METQIHFRGNSAYWKTFKLGTIFPSESTFQSVSRSKKNIFRVFNGLGLNEEVLIILNEIGIKYIEIPFCGEILKTTTKKWLKQGIRSPYSNEKVDRQVILRLSDINLSESDSIHSYSTDNQLNLFGRA
jgi:hypothetical protein